jgi:ABC-type dipeptide/oligopeptide/nickel transport system permease component
MGLRFYIAKRLGLAVITLLGVIVAVFVMTHILPGDPAAVMAGGHATPAVLQALRKDMGLDQPLPVQLVTYIGNLLHGDMGTSTATGHSVLQDLLQRLPATVELSLYSLLIAVLISIPLGVAAAVNRGGWIDRAVQQVAILGASTPLFWLGVVLIYIFYVKLGIAPSPVGRLATGVQAPKTITGFYTIDGLLTLNRSAFASAAGHLLLPVISLTFVVMAPLIKMARDAMSAVLDSDFIQADYSFGLPQRQIIWQDGLKNTMISLLTVVGIVLGYLMAGNVIVETIFSWPGIGLYAWNGINSGDYMATQGFVLLVAVIYVLLNLVIDILYMVIDPRVRLG